MIEINQYTLISLTDDEFAAQVTDHHTILKEIKKLRTYVVQIDLFWNCDQHVICFHIIGCKRQLVWLPKNKEFAIVDRDSSKTTWYSGDYLGHDNFQKALKTLRKWEK